MKHFTINLELGNAAFDSELGHLELARLLRECAERVETGEIEGVLQDINGNSVGGFLTYFEEQE